ncbi:MAG: 4-demethylwyosine synthase TYW1 [Methanomicrobiales archaeon]|nr:4-demethylwyosine synthase TYW1 [Methanomicrobiales archaeon]MDI6876806.1 4-demethylwyosine synthase TYW1 [Methanomicrobiales archaeon]
MRSAPCDPLRRQGYQFLSPGSSAAVKPCLWCKRALKGGDFCYKHQFYGIESHRCIQMTPTLRCTQRCLFCWRSFEHEPQEEVECPPQAIADGVVHLQRRALSGYKPSPYVTEERFRQAMEPRHVAISLAGEPTCYSRLPELVDLFNARGYTTFLVSNGTRPQVLAECRPFQLYVSLDAPDRETYLRLCRPREDCWDAVQESLGLLSGRRSAVRITLVRGWNDRLPERYAAMLDESGPTYAEVKGYMYLGSSRNRLNRDTMPDHHHVRAFADAIAEHSEYQVQDENPLSRVVLMGRSR